MRTTGLEGDLALDSARQQNRRLDCARGIMQTRSLRRYGVVWTRRINVSSIYMLLEDTFILFSLLGVWLLGWGPAEATAAPLHTIDFSGQPDGPAEEWLKQQGFTFRLDADDLQPHFKDNRLVLHTARKKIGLFELPLHVSPVKRIRIHWGVERYPRGADWSQGITAVPIAVMTTFGTEKIKSGSLFVPNAPYFIGLFLGEKEQANRAYTGNYYETGGRYFCTPCGVPVGERVVTEFDLDQTFRTQFGQTVVPPISRFGFQMNTRGTSGGARAFLEKVEYLSE